MGKGRTFYGENGEEMEAGFMLKEGALWYRKGRGLLWWKGMYVMMEGERRMGIFFGQQKQAQGTFPKLMFEKARYKTNRRLYKVHCMVYTPPILVHATYYVHMSHTYIHAVKYPRAYSRRMQGIFGEREQAHNDCICTSHPSPSYNWTAKIGKRSASVRHWRV